MGFLFGSNLDMNGGLGFGGSGNSSPRYVTDFANGLELPGDTFTGGPTVVADNEGTLVTSPAGVLPIEGMRLTDGVWYPTDSSGDLIHASTPLRTTKGTVSKYAEGYKGPLIEPARTNKVTYSEQFDNAVWAKIGSTIGVNAGVAPDGTTTADSYAHDAVPGSAQLRQTSAVVTAGAMVTGSIYAKRGNNDWLYLALISPTFADGGHLWVNLATGEIGTVGNIGTGIGAAATIEALAGGWYGVTISTSVYGATQYVLFTHMPTSNGSTTRVGNASCFLWGAQLEVGAFPTSYIPTGATTITRPAANLTRPTAGTALEGVNDFAIYGRVIPMAGGQGVVYPFASFVDSNNNTYTVISAGKIYTQKKILGTTFFPESGLNVPADTTFEYLAYQHSVHGMGIAVRSWDGSAWSAWSDWVTKADTQDAPIASTYQIGARNNANHFAANYPFTEIIELPLNQNPQTWLMDQLDKGRI